MTVDFRDGKWVFSSPPPMRVVERRIWFWQQRRLVADGWTVRAPGRNGDRILWRRVLVGLFRLSVARLDKVRHVGAGVVDGLDGCPSPLRADLGWNVRGDGKKRGLGARLVDQFLEFFRRPMVDDLAHGEPAKQPEPVQYRQPKLSINQQLELLGHDPIHCPDPSPDVADRVRAAMARKGLS